MVDIIVLSNATEYNMVLHNTGGKLRLAANKSLANASFSPHHGGMGGIPP